MESHLSISSVTLHSPKIVSQFPQQRTGYLPSSTNIDAHI